MVTCIPLRCEWLTGELPNRNAEVRYLFPSLFPGSPGEGRGGEGKRRDPTG